MGLQVRVRHALGERVLDLPERGVDRPVVIGRAADADVQVPSVHVGQRHLVLFVHEGRWVAQDAPGGTGTMVNGAAMKGARPLNGGDVLALGTEADAPTVEVEEAGVSEEHSARGRQTTAVEAAVPAGAAYARRRRPPRRRPGRRRPRRRGSRRRCPRWSSRRWAATGRARAPRRGPPRRCPRLPPPAEWTPEAEPKPRPSRRKGRSWVGQLVAGLSIVLSVAIVTGAILFVYLRKQDQERQDRERAAVAAQQQEQQERERRDAIARRAGTPPPRTRPARRQPRPVPVIGARRPPADITEEVGRRRTTREVAVTSPDAPATAADHAPRRPGRRRARPAVLRRQRQRRRRRRRRERGRPGVEARRERLLPPQRRQGPAHVRRLRRATSPTHARPSSRSTARTCSTSSGGTASTR